MLNKEHPDFPHYHREWENLINRYDEEEAKLKALGQSCDTLRRELHKNIRELQIKYNHIFIPESGEID